VWCVLTIWAAVAPALEPLLWLQRKPSCLEPDQWSDTFQDILTQCLQKVRRGFWGVEGFDRPRDLAGCLHCMTLRLLCCGAVNLACALPAEGKAWGLECLGF
jgi:hypothetical protein